MIAEDMVQECSYPGQQRQLHFDIAWRIASPINAGIEDVHAVAVEVARQLYLVCLTPRGLQLMTQRPIHVRHAEANPDQHDTTQPYGELPLR